METLKFLMVTTHYPPQYLGGDAALVEYLSKELSRIGHEVHVLHSPGVYKLLRKDKSSTDPNPNTDEVHRHPYKPRSEGIDTLSALVFGRWSKAGEKLESLTKTLRPDVLHWHNTKGFMGLPFSIPGPVVLYTAHDYYSICPRSNLLKPHTRICDKAKMCQVCTLRWGRPPQIWRSGSRRVLHIPDDIITTSPSEFVAQRLKREGFRIDHVVRNFVPDPGNPPPASERNKGIIMYLGLMEKHKGPSTLLEAFGLSIDQQGFNLVLVGEGSLRVRILKRTRELGIEQRVSAPGFIAREELDTLMGQARVLVVPSEWLENAPLVVLEAFAKGLPVIGSNLGGLPEILDSESGSVTYEAGNAAALAECLIGAWNSRDRISEFSRMARNAYARKYAPTTCVPEYLKIIGSSRRR